MPRRVIEPPFEELDRLRTPLTAGERKTLRLLNEHLPAKWEIYVQPHLNGCRPDFVLLNPSIGIGVLEVKDWNLVHPEYHWESGRNDGRRLIGKHDGRTFRIVDPSRRLRQYKQEIFDLYCPRLERKAGFAAISAGLVFPFASEDRVHELFRDSFSSPREYAIGRDAFANSQIERLFPAARLTASRLMTEDLAEDFRSWLREPDHSQEQRLPLPLDPRQREYATTRTASGYRRIRGPAGSGKTTVLAARAANLSAEGKQVLVVTFNITLWHYLRDVSSRIRTGRVNTITWINFHGLCSRLVAILGVEAASKEIWKDHFERNADAFNDLPHLLSTELELEGREAVERYDAILVDEGQDFQPEWWQLLRKLARPGAEMMLVADATQDLYGTARLWTENAMIGAGFRGGWAELPLTYRLPEPLLGFAAEFARKFLPANGRQEPVSAQQELDTEPCSLRWLQVERHEVAETSVEELLHMVRSQRRSAMTDMTVLVDRIDVGELVVAALRERNIKTIDTFAPAGESDKTGSKEDRRKKLAFWKGVPSIKVTTLHSFKGWEARLLILCLTNAGSSMAMAAAYAGLTRLKRHPQGSALTVVCSDRRLRSFGKSWPTYVDATSGILSRR